MHEETVVKLTPASGHKPIVVRIFGDNTEKFIDRGAEMKNLKAITEKNFGAKIFGAFANGRIEVNTAKAPGGVTAHPGPTMKKKKIVTCLWSQEFLRGRALEPNEMYKYCGSIAPKIREFHKMHLPTTTMNGCGAHPQLFHTLREFQSKAAQVRFEDSEKAELLSSLNVGLLANEIDELESLVRRVAPTAEVVACHNDLLSGKSARICTPGATGDREYVSDGEMKCTRDKCGNRKLYDRRRWQ